MRDYCKNVPKCFQEAVKKYGADCPVPVGKSSYDDPGHYINGWDNDWLVQCLSDQWKYLRAKTEGLKPARTWFWSSDGQDASDWKTTAMHIINAEYAGNASYEWFEFKEDENGEKQMYRVNYFERITNTSDQRLQNPALDYIFSHPELSVCAAFKAFKSSPLKK